MKFSLLDLIKLTQKARHQSIKMQNRLLLYWLVMLFVVFMAIIVIMNILGVFSDTEEKVAQVISLQQKNTYTQISKQFENVAAKGIYLSGKISKKISAEKTGETENLIYDDLKIMLYSSSCSGAFAVFEKTSGSDAEVFIRLENQDNGNVYSDPVLYIGSEEIAKENRIKLHENWKPEFDFQELFAKNPADEYYWTEKIALSGTEEKSFLFVVPVYSGNGEHCGTCGIEIGELYFASSYPSFQSDFGNTVTLIAPVYGDELAVSEGMLGNTEDIGMNVSENLAIKEGEYFNTYIGENSAFLGTHQETGITLADGTKLYAATLIPQEIYLKETIANRTAGILITTSLFAVVLVFSLFLSKNFVKPIIQSFEAIGENHIDEAKDSGISEIDNLLSMIRKNEIGKEKNSLPYDIEEMFDEFSKKAEILTPTERSIIKYYADGKEINEIPELCFISINTVRKHNANIYKKLEVGSKEELMLYIELFKRCGRLEELL
ncbi:MAG: helix-turn-helix transcriptional regulator [Clostridia bacterium]|nr:helix-turn-helix transcriptional regulator [Clostridia bacterium]